jgi:hypothetical protein
MANRSISSCHRLQIGNELPARRHEGDLIVQPEGAIVHVAGSDDSDHVVNREVLGVQDSRLRILIDPDACLKQDLVIGSLSVLDDELVGFLRYEQLDRDTAIGGCSDRVLPGTVPSATILIVNSTRTRSMESRQSRSPNTASPDRAPRYW